MLAFIGREKMRKPKGIDNFVWASLVYDALNMQDIELINRIDKCKAVEKELKNQQSSKIGRHNNLEELYILQSISQFREQF